MREISYNKKGTSSFAMLDVATIMVSPNHRCVRCLFYLVSNLKTKKNRSRIMIKKEFSLLVINTTSRLYEKNWRSAQLTECSLI